MKTLVILFVALFSICSFSQENNNSKIFSGFHVGVLAGVNYANLIGGSLVIEGKTNLTENLNIKLLAGYSTINKKEGYLVNTYGYVHIDSVSEFITGSYNVDKILYDVFPVSIGLEYVLLHSIFSPYFSLEAGYNFYVYHTQISNSRSGFAGSYKTYEDLPAEYKNKPPIITEASSMRLAFGLGTTYTISHSVNLDIRYVFQANKYIVNTHQILFGINL